MFTIRRECVTFIYKAEYILKIETDLFKRMLSLPVRNFMSLLDLATKIYQAQLFILNESAIWLVSKESHMLIDCSSLSESE